MQKLKVDMNIGNNMRKLRTSLNMTQDQVVAQLGILGIDLTRSNYSRFETGELNVPVSVIVALHKIYKCSYDDFFEKLDI